jgi:undecaprenyl pyrophosphate phosphatase UppP
VGFDPAVLLAGLAASALASFAAIALLIAFLRRFSTDVFVIYRIGFAAIVALILFSR